MSQANSTIDYIGPLVYSKGLIPDTYKRETVNGETVYYPGNYENYKAYSDAYWSCLKNEHIPYLLKQRIDMLNKFIDNGFGESEIEFNWLELCCCAREILGEISFDYTFFEENNKLKLINHRDQIQSVLEKYSNKSM